MALPEEVDEVPLGVDNVVVAVAYELCVQDRVVDRGEPHGHAVEVVPPRPHVGLLYHQALALAPRPYLLLDERTISEWKEHGYNSVFEPRNETEK